REKIKLVYEVINFQNPTGIKWSDSKKQKLLKLAKKYDFYIIEDDSFSEFYYTDNRPFPLKSFDQVDHERVIYIKTYSKSIMPGLGLALVIPPKKLIEKSIFIKYGLDTNTSGLNQKILELFIKEQYLEEHLTFLRQEFKEKYLYMIKLLSEVPYITVLNIPEGGFFIWILLSQHIKGELFYEKCKESNLSILPGSVFYNDKLSTYKIRLTFVSANLKEIKEGIETIKNILLTCAPPKNNKSKIIL
ncbi:MAG: aminotransferase class I/II-fold pyridoxal phosphate-dependent enzyme, partial [Fusobacterium sp.]